MYSESQLTAIGLKIQKEIDNSNLSLEGLKIYTEAASGPFSLTPFIATLAGAEKVYALGFSSKYASLNEVKKIFTSNKRFFQIPNKKIKFITSKKTEDLKNIDIITNLSGVRPIAKKIIDNLREESVISLMYEGWEFRNSDVDLKECKRRKILVFGTNEVYAKVFDFCGILALKLLLEANVEILGQQVLLIGNQKFIEVIEKPLKDLSMNVIKISTPDSKYNSRIDLLQSKITDRSMDVIIVADAVSKTPVIHSKGLFDPTELINITKSPILIQVAGSNDINTLQLLGMKVHPFIQVEPQKMPYTLAYVGLTPIIRLQVAGLKVGELMANYRRQFPYAKCIEKLLKEPLISPIPSGIFHEA